MTLSQAPTGFDPLITGEDFIAPIRSVAQRHSPAGFLLGAGTAALLVLSLAGGGLFLSRSFADPTGPSFEQFDLSPMPSLSLAIGRGERIYGAVG
jgi:hypothetical protein